MGNNWVDLRQLRDAKEETANLPGSLQGISYEALIFIRFLCVQINRDFQCLTCQADERDT